MPGRQPSIRTWLPGAADGNSAARVREKHASADVMIITSSSAWGPGGQLSVQRDFRSAFRRSTDSSRVPGVSDQAFRRIVALTPGRYVWEEGDA